MPDHAHRHADLCLLRQHCRPISLNAANLQQFPVGGAAIGAAPDMQTCYDLLFGPHCPQMGFYAVFLEHLGATLKFFDLAKASPGPLLHRKMGQDTTLFVGSISLLLLQLVATAQRK